jgi:hypothetical protein
MSKSDHALSDSTVYGVDKLVAPAEFLNTAGQTHRILRQQAGISFWSSQPVPVNSIS